MKNKSIAFFTNGSGGIVKSNVHDSYGLKGSEIDIADIISEFAGTVNMFIHLSFQ